MSDDLDPTLLRLFSQADESLPAAAFQQQLALRLHREQSWLNPSRFVPAALGTVISGLAAGWVAAFGYPRRAISLSAIAAAAFMTWMAIA